MTLNVMTEDETIEACQRFSIARFGDGELRLAIGGACSSQRAEPGLARELTDILAKYRGLLVGIPNFEKTPRRNDWAKYALGHFRGLYRQERYASAFITRPDNAPWIDRDDYWAKVRALWGGKDVLLVAGDEKSLTGDMLKAGGPEHPGARSCVTVCGPRQHAYALIDALEKQIVADADGRRILLCLGATATALAARLHRRGLHALDLGHIGMFMRHAGAYAFTPDQLHSKGYRQQLTTKHDGMKWGKSGHSHAPEVIAHARAIGAKSVVDYGCGRGTLKAAVPDLKVFEYDPGIPAKATLPKPADMVVCTDVLEHIEPDKLQAVLQHLYLLARRGAYLVIAMSPARELLPDGRNAHLIVEGPAWWHKQLAGIGWRTIRTEVRKGLCVWLEK